MYLNLKKISFDDNSKLNQNLNYQASNLSPQASRCGDKQITMTEYYNDPNNQQ